MPPRGQKAAPKAGRRAAARQASGPTTQLDDLPDSVLGLIFSLAGDACGPNISAVSCRWRRVWFSEPAVWREFVLRPAPPPEAALRLDAFGEGDWPRGSDEELSEVDSEAGAAGEWWEGASAEQVAAAFAARRRQLRQTAHLVTRARLHYDDSGLQEQPRQPSDWKLWQAVRELPVSLEGLNLDSWMEMEEVTRGEAQELVAATSDALARFSQLTELQLNVNTLPKSAAASLAGLTGLSSLSLQADQIAPAVVDSVLGLSRLTSLALHPCEGLLPAQRLANLPQRLPLLVNLKLSGGNVDGSGLEEARLPAPADFPHLRTYAYCFEFCRRRFQIGGVTLAACSYEEEKAAGGGFPLWKCHLQAAHSRRRKQPTQWSAGPPQGRLRVNSARLPADSTLQQLLEQLLPPCGVSFGALELEECRLTPAQCGACPLLHGLNELAVKAPHFLPDGYTAAQAEEFFFDGRPSRPPQGSAADLARKAAAEPVLAALMAQMPRLERLTAPSEDDGVPACVVQRSGLRFLDLAGGYLEQLAPGPYLHSLETLLLDTPGFEQLPRALAAATRCRYLSLNLCYHTDIMKKSVDDILVKMAALEELYINKAESWNPYSYPLPLLLYMQQRLPGVRVVTMAREFGGSGALDDLDGSGEDWEGVSSGWDSEGGSGSVYGLSREEEDEEEEEQQQQPAGGRGRAGASGSRQPRAKAKPTAKARPAAKGRTAAGAAKGKAKQPAAKGKDKQLAKGKQKQQQKQQPARKRKGGK